MATHIFCPSCGSKNDFANGRKPNFCSGCGYNFASLAAFGAPTPAPAARPQNNAAFDVSVGDEHHTGRGQAGEDAEITRDDVEIEGVPTKIVKGARGDTTRVVDTSRPTLGSFFANPVPPELARHDPKGHKVKRPNGKKIFESFKAEAGAGGARGSEVGGGGNDE